MINSNYCKNLVNGDFYKDRSYNYLYQSTASKAARDFRGNMLRKILST